MALRQRSQLQARIAKTVGVSEPTVSRVLARTGLSKHTDLAPREPVQRDEHPAPGDLLHIDTKKLGRIERSSHRIARNRRNSVSGARWEPLFVAIDDHARIAFTVRHPDGKPPLAVRCLKHAVSDDPRMGSSVRRQLTDDGLACRFKDFAAACKALGIKYQFTPAYRVQANRKAERFIQSALRDRAHGWTHERSTQRTEALAHWQHHYNRYWAHSGLTAASAALRPRPAFLIQKTTS